MPSVPNFRFAILTVALATPFMGSCAAESGPDVAPVAEAPFPDDPDLWPSIREDRIRTLLGPAMARAGVDAWVVLARENANDPVAAHVGAENAGGLAAFLFFADGDGGLRSLAISPVTESTALAEVNTIQSNELAAAHAASSGAGSSGGAMRIVGASTGSAPKSRSRSTKRNPCAL